MRADTWDGSIVVCRECGSESPHHGGLARHVRHAHEVSLFDYYAKHPTHLLDRIQRTSDLEIHREELGPCWIVRGREARRGYKTIRVAGAPSAVAHRLAVFAATGTWPEDLVLHQCDVRACANPEHLRVGTHAENMRERAERERTCRGSDVHSAVLDVERVRAIRALHRDGGCTYGTLAEAFGVSKSAIDHVVNRRSFAWVEDVEPVVGGEDFVPW